MHIIAKLIEPRTQIDESRKRFGNRALLALIVPIIIEQFLVLLVGIADSLMVSYAGEEAVSGVSLVDQLNNVFIRVFTALAAGGAVVASQYIGSKDGKNGSKAASQLILITSLLGAASALTVLLFGRQIFGALFGSVDPGVLDAACCTCGSLPGRTYSLLCITPVRRCTAVWARPGSLCMYQS